MSWNLKVSTSVGGKIQDHVLKFELKDDADAALDEAMAALGAADSGPVKIAGRLVLVKNQIVSAEVYEQHQARFM
jgi:hypothetical protein